MGSASGSALRGRSWGTPLTRAPLTRTPGAGDRCDSQKQAVTPGAGDRCGSEASRNEDDLESTVLRDRAARPRIDARLGAESIARLGLGSVPALESGRGCFEPSCGVLRIAARTSVRDDDGAELGVTLEQRAEAAQFGARLFTKRRSLRRVTELDDDTAVIAVRCE